MIIDDKHIGVEVKQDYGSTIREPTEKEIEASQKRAAELGRMRKQYEELGEKIEALEYSCKHTVIYDEDGWPYYLRYCYACGKFMGTI